MGSGVDTFRRKWVQEVSRFRNKNGFRRRYVEDKNGFRRRCRLRTRMGSGVSRFKRKLGSSEIRICQQGRLKKLNLF